MARVSNYVAQIENSAALARLDDSEYLAVIVRGGYIPQVAEEWLIEEICVHCNNYFTPRNAPQFDYDNVLDNAPEGFLRLADDIARYIEKTDISNVVSSHVNVASESIAIEFSSWKIMFSQQLALYKRLRVI